jgi:redox-sensitive bicupin YhaK (pirin superfamily)
MNLDLTESPARLARSIVHRTRGHSHGPITRLVSPSDLGELIKPFVFLDYFDIDPKRSPGIGFHPHSGIATLTLLLEGQVFYEDTSGAKGIIEPGGVEWMRAAGGVWHTGGAAGTTHAKGCQLWIALPPEMERIESEAQYLGGERFRSHGPARVILGHLGEVISEVRAPKTMHYLDIRLKKGEQWRYQPPADHTVAWVALHAGKLATPEIVDRGELTVFEEPNSALQFTGFRDAGFVLGSAVKHPHARARQLLRSYEPARARTGAKQRSRKSANTCGRRVVFRKQSGSHNLCSARHDRRDRAV